MDHGIELCLVKIGLWSLGGNEGRNNNIDPSAFIKSPCRRMLRKGCHDAPVCDWAPMTLPIVAFLPTNALFSANLDGGKGGKNKQTKNESNETVR